MKLTDRLQCIADEIRQGETMADVGTDHGFLAIALLERGICPRVIMTDVSAGSLTKAEQDLSREASRPGVRLPSEKAEFRQGDGLSVLSAGEVDAVVLAGMGGILMTEILDADLPKTVTFGKYILQPRNNPGRLRAWLLDHDFRIAREQIVRERRFLCEILTAVPPARLPSEEELAAAGRRKRYGIDPRLTAELDYPAMLLAERDQPLLAEYLERCREKHERILEKIRENGSAGTDEKQKLEEARIRRIRDLERTRRGDGVK